MNRYENVFTPVATLQRAPVTPGGMCSVKLFKWEDVDTWPEINPATGVMDATITLAVGAVLYTLPLIDETAGFFEDEQDGPAGKFFNISVKGLASGSNAANILSLATMRHHRWGIIAADRNNVTRLIGNPDGGAKLLQTYTSGEGNTSRKTELAFNWKHQAPAPIYTAEAFTIVVGGVILTAGCLTLVLRFEVGAVGAPMVDGDTVLVDAGFTNKNLLVLVDGVGLPMDDGSGSIDFTGSIQRHVAKLLASDTLTFLGGVVATEKIEIYAWS